jgi:hypothetical protein
MTAPLRCRGAAALIDALDVRLRMAIVAESLRLFAEGTGLLDAEGTASAVTFGIQAVERFLNWVGGGIRW